MELRPHPRYDPVWPHYEAASVSGDTTIEKTIGLNTMSNTVRSALINGSLSISSAEFKAAQQTMEAYATEALEEVSTIKGESFTDFHRLVSSVTFLDESTYLPLLFGANTAEVQRLRRAMVNGIAGKNFDLLESELELLAMLQKHRTDSEEGIYARVRGALQEDTLMALLNYAQDGSLAVLPSTYYEDVELSIDARAHYIDTEGTGWIMPVSIKTSEASAIEEKELYPDYIVLSGESIGNKHGAISRLLVRELQGSPGITSYEKAQLEEARQQLIEQFVEQLPHAETKPIKRLPSSKVIQFIRQHYAA